MFEKLTNSPLALLLEDNEWGAFQPLLDRLFAWPLFPLFRDRFLTMKREALFTSLFHGSGHIERVLLLGALLCLLEEEGEADTALLMDMCAYHDVGRVSDWLDEAHGARSSYKLEELTGRAGEELKMIKAGVEAHSRRDDEMDKVLRAYDPADPARCRRLAVLLKDADGLDRVRIGDLDPAFMRTPAAKSLVPFSQDLFKRYSAAQERLGQQPIKHSNVDRVILEQMRDHVQDSLFAREEDAAVTVLRGLGELFDTALPTQLLQAAEAVSGAGCSGAQCGIVEGALLFLGLHYAGKGRSRAEIRRLSGAFAAAYAEKWGSLRCADLRPGGVHEDDPPTLCAGLVMEGILFTREFILKERGNS